MTKYHPETRFITDYAAGSLPASQALCLSAHLHYCGECRQKIEQLKELGSALFDELSPVDLQQDFSSLMEHIDKISQTSDTMPQHTQSDLNKTHSVQLPSALEKLTGGNINSLAWKNIGKNFRFTDLSVGDPERETSMFYIKAGGSVPRHRHKGEEITVVLKGSFSDQDDHYQLGDFIVRTPGEIHTPVAAQDEDCLCLSTLDAPIQMTNWFYRLLMPFVNASSQST